MKIELGNVLVKVKIEENQKIKEEVRAISLEEFSDDKSYYSIGLNILILNISRDCPMVEILGVCIAPNIVLMLNSVSQQKVGNNMNHGTPLSKNSTEFFYNYIDEINRCRQLRKETSIPKNFTVYQNTEKECISLVTSDTVFNFNYGIIFNNSIVCLSKEKFSHENATKWCREIGGKLSDDKAIQFICFNLDKINTIQKGFGLEEHPKDTIVWSSTPCEARHQFEAYKLTVGEAVKQPSLSYLGASPISMIEIMENEDK